MSSIAFPAFERAQQQHMGSDRSAAELYQSVADAVSAPNPISTAPHNDRNASQATALSQSMMRDGSTQTLEQPVPKITKRVNARLQLAAALIEADNERILEKARFWHIYHPPHSDDLLHPPPPPQPALASQSAIFAPFREGASIAVKRHVRTWSAATGLSRLLDADDDGRRPSIDFLGVALPTEQKARSRAGSSVAGFTGVEAPRSRSNSLFSNAATSALGRTSRGGSRPASILGLGADDAADADVEALSDWGVDKFLSKEERERIAAGQRSRPQSLAGSAGARPSSEQPGLPLSGRKSLDATYVAPDTTPAQAKANSEVAGPSAATAPEHGAQDLKLELLAKIKLYRERQENLPPSEWDGPGPAATKEQVVEHIIASSEDNKRKSLRQASQELNDAPASLTIHGAPSGASITSPPGSTSVMNRPRPSSRADSTASSAFLAAEDPKVATIPAPTSTVAAEGPSALQPAIPASDSGFLGAQGQPHPQDDQHGGAAVAEPRQATAQCAAVPIPPALHTSSSEPLGQDDPLQDVGMVGVGSYSRSQSRRNSFLAGPLQNPHDQGASPSPGIEHSASMPLLGHHGPMRGAPSASPLGPARLPSQGWIHDQFAEHDLGLGPSPFAAALQAASQSLGTSPEFRGHEADPSGIAARAPTIDFNNLTTRQLQNVARNSTFPSHLGINRDLLAEQELEDVDDDLEENEFGPIKRRRQPSYDLTALAQDLAQTGGDNFEIQLGGGAAPDLSSANWGKPRKKWFRLSMMVDPKGKLPKSKKPPTTDGAEGDGESDAEMLDDATAAIGQSEATHRLSGDPSDLYAAEPSANMAADTFPAEGDSEDIDDDYISPPRRGPLRPRGLPARMPQTIIMPQPLQGSEFAPKLRLTDAQPTTTEAPPAPKRHSLHVPDGFVLHNNRGGLPPMRSLVVHSANGPQPMFTAKSGTKKQQHTHMRPKVVEIDRTVRVPAAAPRGIGRRAAAPTTALFRNQLVQHDDEREGWGWEAGTRVDDILGPDNAVDSDDDDKPLADIKKQSRSAKRAAKRLAKAKRKRKAARRVRRAKREQALKEGKSFQEVGVDELSPDEDLDLSSTTSEEDATETETDSDLWASDDDKRWVDDSKPAGRLYGKSLLDLATERNMERKSKARFYGQVQFEDGEATMLHVGGEDDTAGSQRLGVPSIAPKSVHDDGASVAPSLARSFRDKPLGYNDTRERMEAVFGADQIWAREMAQRREEEAREAQLAQQKAEAEAAAQQRTEALARAKKERGLFGKKSKKTRDTVLHISNPSAFGSTTSFAGSDTGGSFGPQPEQVSKETEEAESIGPARSQTPVEPPVIALDIGAADDELNEGRGGRKTPALLAGEEKAAEDWLIASDVETENGAKDNDSSDDDVPLSQIKKNVLSRPVSLAAGFSLLPTKSDSGDSDEELPLAALKEKRIRQSLLLGRGMLDLDLSSVPESPYRNGTQAVHSGTPSSVHSNSVRERANAARDVFKAALSQESPTTAALVAEGEDDSDDDLPLGQRHPGGDAALAAMRAALEDRKRAMKEAKQAEREERRAARLARQARADGAEEDGEEAKVDSQEDVDEESDEDDDSEDDKPLGYVHPQAAIIAEQAALIRQLQAEKEQQQQQQQQQSSRIGGVSPLGSGILSPSTMDLRSSMVTNRMSGLPSLGGLGGIGGMGMGMADPRYSLMGLPTGGSVITGAPHWDGLPAVGSGLPMGMTMSPSIPMGMPMAPGSQIGVATGGQAGAISSAMTMPIMAATPQMGPSTPNAMTMMLDPKASSIHNWRTQVPPDATATVTPPGGASTLNSAG